MSVQKNALGILLFVMSSFSAFSLSMLGSDAVGVYPADALQHGDERNAPRQQIDSHPRGIVKESRPYVKRRPFTQEEDARLIELVEKLGCNWIKVAAQMPNRNKIQCAYRWKNNLNPVITEDPWTSSEDLFIWTKCAEGASFSIIALRLHRRSREQVCRRWISLKRTRDREASLSAIPATGAHPGVLQFDTQIDGAERETGQEVIPVGKDNDSTRFEEPGTSAALNDLLDDQFNWPADDIPFEYRSPYGCVDWEYQIEDSSPCGTGGLS